MFHSFIHHWKKIGLFITCFLSFYGITAANANTPRSPLQAQSILQSDQIPHYPKYGEWRYNPHVSPPTLIWWNERMDMVPVLYISFLPDRIILDAITPVWPDTGIIFYIKDQSDKLGLNLTLHNKTNEHCFYRAIIYSSDRQNFINDLVTSHKARLITPSSYSQSLSLKHVYHIMQDIITTNPNLKLTMPAPTKYSR